VCIEQEQQCVSAGAGVTCQQQQQTVFSNKSRSRSSIGTLGSSVLQMCRTAWIAQQHSSSSTSMSAFSNELSSHRVSFSSSSSSWSDSEPAQGFVRGGFTPDMFPPERLR
jgi:hypothetical protein